MNHAVVSPWRMVADVWQHRYLLGQLIKRDVLLRYRGALLGVLWIFLSPLCMMLIFAFVFGQIFQARWSPQGSGLPFWLLLFAGLIAFNLFADTVSRAPHAVRNYPSFVKKIIFPVNILPLVPLGAALVHATVNLGILVLALALTRNLHWQLLLFPIVITPVLLLGLGLSWYFAAWGVFIKDIAQIMPMFLQMLMFMSPVFYPSSVVPAGLRTLYRLNPLGIAIEGTRALATGEVLAWGSWSFSLLFGLAVAMLGYAFFQRNRDEFADVL